MNAELITDLFSLRGKTAIITGGAGRLGFRIAKIFSAAGAKVISFDVTTNPALDPLVVTQMNVDITQKEQVLDAVRDILTRGGKASILVNCAAFNPRVGEDSSATGDDCWKPHEDYPENLWRKEFEIGLYGAQWCIQAIAPHMIERKEGSIINVSSTSGLTAPDHRKYEKGKFKSAAYPVVKTGLLGLTRSWASYFSERAPGVRVNVVCLGAIDFGSMSPEFVKTLGERNMLKRPARPNEYDGLFLFLASEASSFITGSVVVADGGQTAW